MFSSIRLIRKFLQLKLIWLVEQELIKMRSNKNFAWSLKAKNSTNRRQRTFFFQTMVELCRSKLIQTGEQKLIKMLLKIFLKEEHILLVLKTFLCTLSATKETFKKHK
jgi:hypothetical protein